MHIVGAKSDEKYSFPIRFIDWSEETEVASIQNFDIGIMPLEDSPWEKGKCAYKIIQYMACGLREVPRVKNAPLVGWVPGKVRHGMPSPSTSSG